MSMRIAGHSHNKLTILGILALALFLRLYKLNNTVIWYDEADSIASATRSVEFYKDKEIVYKPFYFILLKAWIKLFGVTPCCVRLLSVFFGLWSIYGIYALGKTIFDKKTGLFLSFVLTVSPLHVYYSREVRHFSLILFLTILSFYFFVLLLKYQKVKFFVLSLVLNILAILTHPFAIFILLSQFLTLCFARNIYHKRRFILVLIFLFLIYLGIFLSSFEIIAHMTLWMHNPGFKSLKDIFSTLAMGGENYGRQTGSLYKEPYAEFPFLKIVDIAALLIFFPIFLRGIFKLFNDKLKRSVVLLWFFVPIICSYAISYLFLKIFCIKHLIIVLPAFFMIVMCGCFSIESNLLSKLSTLSLIAVMALPLPTLYEPDLNVNWEIPVNVLNKYGKPNDTVLVATSKEVVSFLYYFRTPNRNILVDICYWGKIEGDEPRTIFYERGYRIILVPETRGELIRYPTRKLDKEKILQGKGRVWFLASNWSDVKEISSCRDYLIKNGYVEGLDKKIKGISITLFQKTR